MEDWRFIPITHVKQLTATWNSSSAKSQGLCPLRAPALMNAYLDPASKLLIIKNKENKPQKIHLTEICLLSLPVDPGSFKNLREKGP